MSTSDTVMRRQFTRNADRAVIAGVCAGLADHFGFKLCVTRALAVIALFMACPLAIIIYFAVVFLTPTSHDPERQPRRRRRTRSESPSSPSSPSSTLSVVRRRYQSLDSRLARLERYVTSARFNLDEELRKL
jgi:phage shock protein C